MNEQKGRFRPDRVLDYFRAEWAALAAVTVSGLIYNLGLLAGPWFEGRMAGRLIDVLGGKKTFADMLTLVLCYAASIAVVQGARYVKRFYVRRFANNVNRRMKRVLYGNLVRKSRAELEADGAGSVMTKAISDVDDCAEGMRKFTTEVFDTGVALAAYAAMLLVYDWRLALLSMLFPPISYWIAERMKTVIQRTGAACKEEAGRLSAATLDRAANAVTYRVFGCESQRRADYERELDAYESAAVRANVWNAALPPVYRIISMAGTLLILFFGARNIRGDGWTAWDVAAFTTFLSCFTKLATKSSSAAKLFNAVHKAQVSWRRIRPLMQEVAEDAPVKTAAPGELRVESAGFAYPGGPRIFEGLTFSAQPGQIVGITGPVACGKSTLGKLPLCEAPYEGSVRLGGRELSQMTAAERTAAVGYLGHSPELFNDTIENNVRMGDAVDVAALLRAVCLDGEVAAMPEGDQSLVGNGGVRLSGGQAQRLALARTLGHPRPLLVLDDPFSALDRATETQIFENLRAMAKDSVVLLISHRLYLFPQMDQVIWMNDGRAEAGTHAELAARIAEYAALAREQEVSGDEE